MSDYEEAARRILAESRICLWRDLSESQKQALVHAVEDEFDRFYAAAVADAEHP